jgi:hypothetical protein
MNVGRTGLAFATILAVGIGSWLGCSGDETSNTNPTTSTGATGGGGSNVGGGGHGGTTAGGGGQGGAPCQAPLTGCGGECVLTDTDPNHCGDCATVCDVGQICLDAACVCSPSLTECPDGCFDLQTDMAHCGTCDVACLTGQACVTGDCTACPQGQTPCLAQGTCADLLTDAVNCGFCGADCVGGTCSNGMCVCQGSLVSCNSGCVDVTTDELNCGACEAPCLVGQTCTSGQCGACPLDTIECLAQGVCANLLTDNANCGTCGRVCGPGGTCTNGACVCQANYVECGPIFGCVGLSSDPNHCGACGNKCSIDQSCVSGSCVCANPSDIECDGHCTDPTIDPYHCGTCNNQCDLVYGQCTSGACGCVGGLAACHLLDNVCTDTQEDPSNCGVCGEICTARQICVAGGCECKPGLTLVDVTCVDTASDPTACGSNLVQCSGNTPSCENGVCVASCSQHPDTCGSACVDLDWDPLHCGGCDAQNVCAADEVCITGNCRAWMVGVACNACPCDLSCAGEFNTCCMYPGATSLTICIGEGPPGCPQ